MNSFTNDSDNNPIEIFHAPAKRRRKEGKEEKNSKKKKAKKDMIENVDVNVGNQEAMKETPESPIFMPSLSSPEPDTPDSCVDTPIQSHANVDLATLSLLSSNNVARLRQERDRLQLAGLRKRHTLLHQLDRSTWPLLFAALRLQGHLSETRVYENAEDFEQLRTLLIKKEDAALEVLKKWHPPRSLLAWWTYAPRSYGA